MDKPRYDVMTALDAEPPPGSRVKDSCDGLVWERQPEGYWIAEYPDGHDSDPESWTKVAGNYGPVFLHG